MNKYQPIRAGSGGGGRERLKGELKGGFEEVFRGSGGVGEGGVQEGGSMGGAAHTPPRLPQYERLSLPVQCPQASPVPATHARDTQADSSRK
uniref:Uncharacterized protein n=1 Tax=Knipowitschia caucasica TaxID=637954 RepID=A0AAV2IZC6_KNICA